MTAISNNTVQRASMAKPTAERASRRILPSENERRNGGLYFEARQAPAQFPQLQISLARPYLAGTRACCP